MPLGIALALVGVVGAFVLFNTGQVAVNKQRLSDAADSAAYSGMVWQARALNFQAYTNRAMIANDVTIGQAVSLTSWSTYSAIASDNIATVTDPVPIVGQIIRSIAQIFKTVNSVIEPVSDAIVSVVGVINGVIGVAQESMFASAFMATPDIVDKVAKASDDNFEAVSGYAIAGLFNNLNSWQAFTEEYSHDDIEAMRERTDLVSQSRDDFATNRRWKFFHDFWLFTSPFTQYKLYYSGQTRLLMSTNLETPQWEWVGKDGLSLHQKRLSFKLTGVKTKRDQLPIGWASAYANSQNSNSSATIDERNKKCQGYYTLAKYGTNDNCDFLGPLGNGVAEGLANEGFKFKLLDSGPIGLTGYNGIQAFRSLSKNVLEDEDGSGDPVLRLRTEISMDMQDTETTNDWVHDSEPFATELASAGKKMSSISVAEVYYRHPKAYRTENHTIKMQRANGYNPYWDVRLAPIDLEERLVALALRDGVVGGGGGSSTPGSEQLDSYDGGNGNPGVDVAGNITDLPEYAVTLASAMELDDGLGDALEAKTAGALTEATQLLEDTAGISITDIAGFMQVDTTLNEIENDIKEKLKAKLEEAAEKLARDFLGSTEIGGVNVGETIEDAEGVVDDALAINERMEEVREAVAADFIAALSAEVGPYEEVVADLRSGVAPRLGIVDLNIEIKRLEDLVNEEEGNRSDGASQSTISALNAAQADLRALYEDIRTETMNLTTSITDQVIASMTTHGAEFFEEGIDTDLRDFLAKDIEDMIQEYLDLTPEDRLVHETGTGLPWDREQEDEEEYDKDAPPDNYNEDDYGKFED